jgi:Mrp family chromosome partitioning ATPase/capsular polysaccharide biosynthesis protein
LLVSMSETTEQRDLRDYIRPVLRRWWLILAVVPVVTVGTYLYYDHKPKVYTASTQLYVQPSALNQLLLGGSAPTSPVTVGNLAHLIETRAVGSQAARVLRQQKAGNVVGSVTSEPLEATNFIIVSATSPSPRDAALLANAYAKGFLNTQARQLQREAQRTQENAQAQLETLRSSAAAGVRAESLEEKIQTLELVTSQPGGSTGIKQVDPALPVPTPVGHDPMSRAIFAFVVSLMLAIAACFGLEYMTRNISSVEDVEEIYEFPVLTEIPKVDTPAPVVSDGIAMEKQLHEPFHRLQMNLDMLAHERPLRTILVASAAPGEGKSMVSRNLSLSFRDAGHNVAVIDADFRKATLGGLLDAQEGPGLTDILAGRASFGQTVQEVAVRASENGNSPTGQYGPGAIATHVAGNDGNGDLALVPAGLHQGNLTAALANGGMAQTLKSASDVYDRVVIDSSPILAAADVLPLLSQVDGVLIVTRLGVSTRESAKRLISEIRRVSNIKVVGVVVNGIPPRTYRTRAYGYYYG